jgi:hypothetical protein
MQGELNLGLHHMIVGLQTLPMSDDSDVSVLADIPAHIGREKIGVQ